MKKIQFILLVISMVIPTLSFAQSDQKKQERQERRVDTIFSDEEKNHIQLWFYENTKKMRLDQETNDLYSSIINTYTNKIKRLDDKDSTLNQDEIRVEMGKIIETMNTKIKPILSEENYTIHKANFKDLLKMIYEKEGWEWKED